MKQGGTMSLALFDLSGKVAMVTGSTRGLGEVAAKALAKAGEAGEKRRERLPGRNFSR
jgi:NADP-dependent 3-hydroxy acid dehydrogenase YdfG